MEGASTSEEAVELTWKLGSDCGLVSSCGKPWGTALGWQIGYSFAACHPEHPSARGSPNVPFLISASISALPRPSAIMPAREAAPAAQRKTSMYQ